MQSILKSVFVSDLFEKDNYYFIEFKKGSNCLFGDNGTGKTTLIELIVSSLQCNLHNLIKINFSTISIVIENDRNDEVEINISKENDETRNIEIQSENTFKYKSSNDQYETFSKYIENHTIPPSDTEIIYNIGNENHKFIIQENESREYFSKKLYKSREYITLLNKLRQIVSLTHVPLLRIYQDEENIINQYDIWKKSVSFGTIFDTENIIDPSLLVLREIESKFRRIAKEYINSDTAMLETFKSKIIEKFLVDDDDLKLIPKMMRERGDNEAYAISDIMSQLGSAGLNVPERKLVETLTLLKDLETETTDAMNNAEKVRHSKANQVKKLEAERLVSESFIKLLVGRTLFERFESVIKDVEALQSNRNNIWENFRLYEENVNKFLNNKYFMIGRDGSFEVRSGSRKINIENLSSGEKHIIAILGRATLTKDSGSIFIADEPELSLHLTWQRMILPSILSLSPKSQIIVATHSPAIIPRDANKIDLGECR